MKNCDLIEKCSVYARFMAEGMKSHWVMHYCKGGRMSECSRIKLRNEGKIVPLTLLPDGSHIKSPSHKDDSAVARS
jgi:hypothetical protein